MNKPKNRLSAILLAFFLGGLGIHKFYLGQTGKGILYIVMLCTVILSPVVGIMALIDFIILLCMSDEAFDQKYN